MANQMIALGVRGPQLPNLAGAAAQYGNMMANMAAMKEKQASIQRADAFRQLVSDPGFDPANPEHIKAAASLNPEGAEQIARSFDARRKSQQDYTMVEVKRLRNIGAAVGDEAGYQDWLARVEKVSPGDAAAFRQFSPNFDPAKMSRIIMEADQYINKTIATPTASFQVSENGAPQSVTVGGLQPSVKEIPQFRYTPDQPPAPAAAQTAAPAELTPQEAGPILQNATQTQTISEQDAARVRRSLGPQGQPQFDRWLRDNRIQVLPMAYIGNAGEMSPPMRTAEYREPVRDYFSNPGVADYPVENAPVNPLRQDIGYVPTTTRFKSPMQSPTPGSAIVPLPRVKDEARAGEAGKQGVRVVTEPRIAGGTKTAELQAQKDMAFPDAQGQFETALATIDNRLDDISRFRKHPAASRVIGPLDAFTPNFGRARGAQALYDAIVAVATLDELMQMRQNSPTGGALGNVSDADIRLLRESIGALRQDQSEEDFNDNLKIFEDRLRQTRERLIRRYRENYGYRLGKNWQPPAQGARRPPARGRTVGGFTVMEVED